MRIFLSALMIAVPAIVQPAFAQERASMDEARAMALAAAAHVAAHGKEAATAAFMTPGGEWHDRDLYVFALDNSGVVWSHGANDKLVGKDLLSLSDVTGKEFVRDMVVIQTEGWVEYLFKNPQTKEIEPKASYIVRVSPKDVLGVGAYR